MAYAELEDVEHELGQYGRFLTETSTPSEDDVEQKTIPAIAGEIDGVLSARGVTVPVTAPASFLELLSSLNALGAAARTAAALLPQAQGPQSTTFHEWLQARYDAGLERLRNGEGIPDDIATSGTSLPSSFWTRHPDTVSSDLDRTSKNSVDPVFRRDTKW